MLFIATILVCTIGTNDCDKRTYARPLATEAECRAVIAMSADVFPGREIRESECVER